MQKCKHIWDFVFALDVAVVTQSKQIIIFNIYMCVCVWHASRSDI